MIEGLLFDIEFEEMLEHLRVKALHHEERRLFYEESAERLEEGKVEGMDYSGGDPIKALRDKGQIHQNRSELFMFMADHLIEGETYRLSESDLMTLEFISRRY